MQSKRLLGLVAAGAAVTASLALAPPAHGADGPYQRGPEPTEQSVTAERGPFAIAQITVPRDGAQGFGGGTIYYPTSTAEGTFGAVAVSPGFFEPQAAISWYGPRLASQGFVVITIDTVTVFDQPDARAGQLLAALDHLTQRSEVRDRIDPARLGVMGHSMGGGGTIRATVTRPSLKAAVPLTPWHLVKSWPEVRVPTLIVGADNDFIAPVANHAEPFYMSMTNAPEKAYLELNNAGHMTVDVPNTTVARSAIAWLKRFVDEDTRYSKFLCPPPAAGPAIEEYRDTCPT